MTSLLLSSSSSIPHSTTKYRPALTARQLQCIVAVTSSTPALSDDPELKEIRKILVPLLAKIEVGAINPAYKLSETHALKMQAASQRVAYENGTMSAEEEAKYEASILGI